MERFPKAILDLARVQSMGLVFADDGVGVLPRQNPGVVVRSGNANRVVPQMLRHVVDNA